MWLAPETAVELAKYLDELAGTGIDAERVRDLAACEPLPVGHSTT
jgi:hypothetical protein